MTFEAGARAAGLNPEVGKQGMKGRDRPLVHCERGSRISGSVDIDAHFSAAEANSPRWDYGLGVVSGTEYSIWIEVHPANSTREIDEVIRKFVWLKAKLGSADYRRLKELTSLASAHNTKAFQWVATGKCSFRAGGKEEKKLATHGLSLPQRCAIVR